MRLNLAVTMLDAWEVHKGFFLEKGGGHSPRGCNAKDLAEFDCPTLCFAYGMTL